MKKNFLKFLLVYLLLLGLVVLNSIWKPENKIGLSFYCLVFWCSSFYLFKKGITFGRKSAKSIYPLTLVFFLLIFVLIALEHLLLFFT